MSSSQGQQRLHSCEPATVGHHHPAWVVSHMGVSFTPSAEGFVTAVLEVQWTNGESGTSTVALAGIGVTATPPPPTVEDVLAEFDERVANGALYGSGPGNSAEGRLGALRNKIARPAPTSTRARLPWPWPSWRPSWRSATLTSRRPTSSRAPRPRSCTT